MSAREDFGAPAPGRAPVSAAPAAGCPATGEDLASSGAAWGAVGRAHPGVARLVAQLGLGDPDEAQPLAAWLDALDDVRLEEAALDRACLVAALDRALAGEARAAATPPGVGSLRILGGTAKDGSPEDLDLTLGRGDVACVVGPTGSGKSQLLADVECLAQGDTQSGRRVLVDGRPATFDERFSAAGKLVAQLSQSMSYVLDLPAAEFLALHAQSRGAGEDACAALAERTVEAANLLCGEPFGPRTPVCSLSGGQSRALMIADVALLSASPVVLIDELENAGVDRRRALELLMGEGKIVLIATHDPLLMLLGERRVVLAGGAVRAVVGRSAPEEARLAELEAYDGALRALRERLRAGGRAEGPFAPLPVGDGRGEGVGRA